MSQDEPREQPDPRSPVPVEDLLGADSATRQVSGTWLTRKLVCVSCARGLDGHAPAIDDEDTGPSPGALMICAYCATPQMLTESMVGWVMRPLTAEEHAALTAEELAILDGARTNAPLWLAVEAMSGRRAPGAQDGPS